MFCSISPVGDVGSYVSDVDALGDDLDGVERIEVCTPDGGPDFQRQIRRALVIDARLWSLSLNRLHAKDLQTLERLGSVDLVS